MKVKCPKCGSLDTVVLTKEQIDKAPFSSAQKKEILSLVPATQNGQTGSGFCYFEISDVDWDKVLDWILKIIGAVTAVVKLWKALKDLFKREKQEHFIVCNNCHTVSKADF
ncbi:MAG: hypothetical protein MJ016_05445 [Victivallaceae bacterium]|nr:hypothetical protein [Victivallaceae bacterium]